LRIAGYTLGCKVNQYDTQAMLELFEGAGYARVGFHEDADVYLVNTCTVTKTGDDKSLKAIRRVAREHPGASIIVAGCLAQRDAERMRLPGVALVVGTAHRAQVVSLFERARSQGLLLSAVGGADEAFEVLAVKRHEGKTRAVLKIQEGCDRHCSYCIIPAVRGPVRSMPLADVRREAAALAENGYREIVLTGIHLMSYGRGEACALADATRAVAEIPGVARVRLGSLEPGEVTAEFARALAACEKICPQFHLSLQSGSASVLRRMNRRYTPDMYAAAADALRARFPRCALTTDIIAGFPGETDAEFQETLKFCEDVALARIHVFPYSPRAGTRAAEMAGQVEDAVKRARVAALRALGNRLEADFVNRLVGTRQSVLFETESEGYTGSFVRVCAKARAGEIKDVYIERAEGNLAYARKEGH
jgi:threonylcarbamoyladenosine tRNA methylthiotransferase MtaB